MKISSPRCGRPACRSAISGRSAAVAAWPSTPTIAATSSASQPRPDGYQHATLWEVPKSAVTAVPTLDELGRPETPAPLSPLVGATTMADGRAIRVNQAGQALVLRAAGSPMRTFRWSKIDGLIDIGGFRQSSPDLVTTRGTAMNGLGSIVGEALSSAGYYEPFIWSRTDGIRLLSPSALVEQQPAMAVNDAAEVVGSFVALTSYRWSPSHDLVRVVPLGGACGSSALAINVWGESVGGSGVAGTGCDDADPFHAYLSTRTGAAFDLGTLAGAIHSEAVAINGRGQVAAWSAIGEWSASTGGPRQAFFWSSATARVPLGTLGGPSSWPTAVNDLGQVVGTSVTSSGLCARVLLVGQNGHGGYWHRRAVGHQRARTGRRNRDDTESGRRRVRLVGARRPHHTWIRCARE